MVALSLTFVMLSVAMVLDFGLVRLDRQTLKSVSDQAAMAGIARGDGATGDVYTYRAVCGALAHLQGRPQFAPDGAFTGLPDGPCAAATLAANINVKCQAANPATHLAYDQTVVHGGVTYQVKLNAPYDPTEGGWTEEDLSSVTIDQSTMGGCDQVGVQIFETREPGLGSMATSSDLQVGVRSAARALIGSEDDMAPALILLERHACSAVTAGGAAKICCTRHQRDARQHPRRLRRHRRLRQRRRSAAVPGPGDRRHRGVRIDGADGDLRSGDGVRRHAGSCRHHPLQRDHQGLRNPLDQRDGDGQEHDHRT